MGRALGRPLSTLDDGGDRDVTPAETTLGSRSTFRQMKAPNHPDELADKRRRVADLRDAASDSRDDAADANDRRHDALDRLSDELDRRDLLALRATRRRIREQDQR